MTVPTPRGAKRPFVVHCADLSRRDRWILDDIPVTSLARTLLDLAAMLSPVQLERALERAEELGRFDLAALEDVLGRAGHHSGVARLRRALAIYRENQEDLKLRGVEMIRVTGPRLDCEPEAIVRRVAAHLEHRRRQLDRSGASGR